MTQNPPLLSVENLTIEFQLGMGRAIRAVDDVSFTIQSGEIVGLVGESASGKSTLGLALMRMVPSPGKIRSGTITFNGRDVLAMSQQDLRRVRGQEIALIVQDALATMNPVTVIREQIEQVLQDHEAVQSRRQVTKRVLAALRAARLPDGEAAIRRYPHELSGGMQQRVSIAQGLILEPKLIIADEPTTALDVTVQAQILELLRGIADEGTSILFVTHDLATVAEICDRVLVMYAGRVVESGPTTEVFGNPSHPYTQGLLASLLPLSGEPPESLAAIPGQPPTPDDWPTGCRFHQRCFLWEAKGRPATCQSDDPPLNTITATHGAACHFLPKGSL